MSTATKQNNKNLFSLVFTVFLDFVGFGIVIPIIAPILLDPAHGILSQDVAYSTRTVTLGFLIASFTIAQFFGAPILGVLSDKYGRKKILLLSIIGTAVSLFLFGVGVEMKSIYLLFFSRILNGVMGGNVSTAQSAVADMSDFKTKARNFGLIGMAFGLGFVLGPYLGGKLSDPNTVSWFNFSTPYWVASGLATINVFLIWLMFKETLLTPKQDAHISFLHGVRNIGKAFTKPHLRHIFIVTFLAIVGFSFFTQFYQVYLIDKFKYTQSDIGHLYAFIGIWIALTQGGLVRFLSHKTSPTHVVRVSLLTLSIGLFMLLIPQQSYWIYFVLPIVAVSQGATTPNMNAMLSNLSSPQEQGEIMGINQSIASLGISLPPMVAGFLSSIDIRLPLIMAGSFALLSWVVFITVFQKIHLKMDHSHVVNG